MKLQFTVVAALSLASVEASAQSAVTLYGLVENGITYSTNQLGGHAVQAASGVGSGSRWGLKGSEDLGSDLKAIFTLENGFDGFTGALGQGGREFGRQAFVGIATPLGSLTAGRQYDPVVDYLQPYTSNGLWGGQYFSRGNDVDNTDNGFRLDNSIKFASANYNGFTFGGVYSFGNVAGHIGRRAAWGFGANYVIGPLGLAAAYESIDSPGVAVSGYQSGGNYVNAIYGNALANASKQQIGGAGVTYTVGAAKFLASFTRTIFKNGDLSGTVWFNNYEVGAGYYITPSFQVSGGYIFTDSKDDTTSLKPRYHQFNLMGDYFVSKRTDVEAQAVYQIAAGDATQAQLAGLNPSSNKRQLAVRLALRHAF
ncbi:porin [Caballeronia jiangsuensis]|nr:porin [Caballeronia jiangsuensis]